MRRYWVESKKITNQQVDIDGELFHHLVDVCRLGVGNVFELLCGDQKAYVVKLTEVGKKTAAAEIIEIREIEPLALPRIHLALSVPKFSTFETIIEKSVELGVFSILPFVSDYSFVKKLDGPLIEKRDRWEKIIRFSTRQSGRGDLLKLEAAENLDKLLERFNRTSNATGLFLYEGQAELNLKTALTSAAKKEPTDVWVFVGSEGGFSTGEIEKFKSFQLEPVTMGSQVLRVETACLALVSVIKYEFNQMQ